MYDEGEEDKDLGKPVPQPPFAGFSTDEMGLEVLRDPTPLLGTGFGNFPASFGEGDGWEPIEPLPTNMTTL